MQGFRTLPERAIEGIEVVHIVSEEQVKSLYEKEHEPQGKLVKNTSWGL